MRINTIFYTLIALLSLAVGCKKDNETTSKPIIVLKNGDYTRNEQLVPVGGQLKFGITTAEGSAILTNLRIQRVINDKTITELDKGVFIKQGGLDFDFNATKSSAAQEVWQFFVMNSSRDSASTTLTVNLGAGSAYSEINHYPSIKIGMQSNTNLPNYLDLHTGSTYSKSNITGHESEIDLVGFVYTTSGQLSPTLCCPGYSGSSSVTGFYPEIEGWGIKNQTSYDYNASDNNLVSAVEFEKANNDSLLVSSFNPGKVSGLCKYCNSGKIIPFKAENGKYGLVRVLHADLTETGYMELDIKIQK